MPFLRDLRYAMRTLARAPGLTAAMLAAIAVGVGTHATVSGFLGGLLTRNLGIPDAAGLAAIHWRAEDGRYSAVPFAAYEALAASHPAFTALGAFRESRVSVRIDNRASWMSAGEATPELWTVLRLPAARGRIAFAPGADRLLPVVISDRIWHDQFAGESRAIGSKVRIGAHEGRVTGVLPPWFEGVYTGRPIDVWIPLDLSAGTRPPDAVSLLVRIAPTRPWPRRK